MQQQAMSVFKHESSIVGGEGRIAEEKMVLIFVILNLENCYLAQVEVMESEIYFNLIFNDLCHIFNELTEAEGIEVVVESELVDVEESSNVLGSNVDVDGPSVVVEPPAMDVVEPPFMVVVKSELVVVEPPSTVVVKSVLVVADVLEELPYKEGKCIRQREI